MPPDYEILSGGGDLFHPELSPEAGDQLCKEIAKVQNNSLKEAIRAELARGSYQMVSDTLPYDGQAARIAAVLAPLILRERAEAWDEAWEAVKSTVGSYSESALWAIEQTENWAPNPYRAAAIDPEGAKE